MLQLFTIFFTFFSGTLASSVPSTVTDYSCTLSSNDPCWVSFAYWPGNLTASNGLLYIGSSNDLSQDHCSEPTLFRYANDSLGPIEFFFDNKLSRFVSTAHLSALTHPSSSYRLCFRWSTESIDVGSLAIEGPIGDESLNCRSGFFCDFQISGVLPARSSVVVVRGDCSSLSGVVRFSEPGPFSVTQDGRVSLGFLRGPPLSANLTICWSPYGRGVAQNFPVRVGKLEISGEEISSTCQIGADCSVPTSGWINGTLGLSPRTCEEISDSVAPSNTGTVDFGIIPSAPLNTEFALCWTSNFQVESLKIGTLSFYLAECEAEIRAALDSADFLKVLAFPNRSNFGTCGISIDSVNGTVLHGLLRKSDVDLEISKRLISDYISAGGSIDQTDSNGETAIIVGMQNGIGLDLLKFLISYGPSLTAKSSRGLSLLQLSIGSGEYLIAKEVISRLGLSDLEYRDTVYGANSLIWAVQADWSEGVRILLINGLSPISHDARGRTALHFAVVREKPEIVKIILNFCCPAEKCIDGYKDEHGLTPRDIATTNSIKFALEEAVHNRVQSCLRS